VQDGRTLEVQRNSHTAFYVILHVKNASSGSKHSVQSNAKIGFQSLLYGALGYDKGTSDFKCSGNVGGATVSAKQKSTRKYEV
jgi:hypothetical protein